MFEGITSWQTLVDDESFASSVGGRLQGLCDLDVDKMHESEEEGLRHWMQREVKKWDVM